VLARCCSSSFIKQSREQTLSARLTNHLPQIWQRCGAFTASHSFSARFRFLSSRMVSLQVRRAVCRALSVLSTAEAADKLASRVVAQRLARVERQTARARTVMSMYRMLSDHWVGTQYYPAGTVASTADAGGTLPVGWRPSGAVDPLDQPAVNQFYAQGPQATPLVRAQWSTVPVNLPVTYWRGVPQPAVPGAKDLTSWSLTGLGANLPPIMI
jgi:hypothetical protein